MGRRATAVVLAAGLGAAAGCGGRPDRAAGVTVEGRVTLGGAPVPMGLVLFTVPGQPEPRAASLAADGSYRMPGLPRGAARVAVRTAHLAGALAARDRVAERAGRPADGPAAVMVPRRYEDAATSRLACQVDGDRRYDIELTE